MVLKKTSSFLKERTFPVSVKILAYPLKSKKLIKISFERNFISIVLSIHMQKLCQTVI